MDSKSFSDSRNPVPNELNDNQPLEIECFRALIQPSIVIPQSVSSNTTLSETKCSEKPEPGGMPDFSGHKVSSHRNRMKQGAHSSTTTGSELDSPRTLSQNKNTMSDGQILIDLDDCSRSAPFSYIVNTLYNRTTNLVDESTTCRALSSNVLRRFNDKLSAATHEASRFSKQVASLSIKVEERSQVNKRFRAKVKALLAISEKILSHLNALDYGSEVD